MVLPIAPLIGIGVNLIGGMIGRAQQQRAQKEAAKRAAARNNALALQTWRAQVLGIHKQYQAQVRDREWRHMNAMGQYYLGEQKAEMQSRYEEFQYQMNEIDRKSQYDQLKYQTQAQEKQELMQRENRVTEIMLGNRREKAAVAQHNFNVEQQYWAATWDKQLHDLREQQRVDLNGVVNDQVHSLARQQYNISVGAIGMKVFDTQIKANKQLTAIQRKTLENMSARIVMGQSGNTMARLLVDSAREKYVAQEEVLAGAEQGLAAGEVAEAQARMDLARAMLDKRFAARQAARGAVMGVRAEHFDAPDAPDHVAMPDMPEYRAAPNIAREYVPGVKPIRGPAIPKPTIPEAPILMSWKDALGGAAAGNGSAIGDIISAGLQVGHLAWQHSSIPGSPPATTFQDQRSAGSHPMGGGYVPLQQSPPGRGYRGMY